MEAARTLRFYGQNVLTINDVGVAGIWRLFDRLESLKQMSVVIVAAGMDGALPSVVGGLVSGCVIALPTSFGYGFPNGGHTPFNSPPASLPPPPLLLNSLNRYRNT